MDAETQPRQTEALNSSNDGYTNAGVIQLRLDTAPMLDTIEAFLRGRKIVGYRENEDGGYAPVYGSMGMAKMNEEGIQSLMSWLNLMFSPHTVQGNYGDRQELNEYLCYVQKGLAKYLMANREEWNLKRQDFAGVVRGIMNCAEPFFSRLIGNKERESYQATMRTVETNRMGEERKGLIAGLFGGGGK